jgi:hypothetical protein
MKRVLEIIKGNSARIQASLSTIVKIILVLSIFYATYYHLWHILFANLILLFLMFAPFILRQRYKVHIPREFEFIFLLFVVISFFLGEIRGIVIQTFFGILVGFMGFTIMLILFSNSKFKTNYSLIILFSFSFSLTFGLVAEMLKYYFKIILNYNISLADYNFAMVNLTMVALGSFISSILGYVYMKGYKIQIVQYFVGKFKKRNPNLFIERTDSPEEVLNLIKKGENEKLEFKSTLRTNLHTGEHDKKMEISILKTLVAMMNSEGGTLLIGVSDIGEILSIEKDKFENNDKFNIHLTNLVKEKIGKEYLPYLNFQLILIEGKNIMKIECNKSDKPVFLKCDGLESFFIRTSAGSTEVKGSKLVEYINNKFKI